MNVKIIFQNVHGFQRKEVFYNVERISIDGMGTRVEYGKNKRAEFMTLTIFRIFADGEKIYENLND